MNKQSILLVAAGFILGVATVLLFGGRGDVQAQQPGGAVEQKFFAFELKGVDGMNKQLEAINKDGWESTGLSQAAFGEMLVMFKRVKK
jgi:hypothetical protein